MEEEEGGNGGKSGKGHRIGGKGLMRVAKGEGRLLCSEGRW